MRKIYFYTLYVATVALALSSCGASFTIKGETDGSMADGQKYYLSSFSGNELKNIDSCDVVHGQFEFHGSVDTVKLGLVVSDEFILPVILEGGDIDVTVDSKTGTEVGGSHYNDLFSTFRKDLEKIENEMDELSNRQLRGIKNGEDEDSLNMALTREARSIMGRKETLIKKFITDNMDNPLAAAAFQGLTIVPFMMQGGYAELSPWIDEILTKANDSFKNDPYVKFYIERAKVIEGINNGTIELPQQQQQQQQQEEEPNRDSADRLQELEGTIPTPNQLAEPAK